MPKPDETPKPSGEAEAVGTAVVEEPSSSDEPSAITAPVIPPTGDVDLDNKIATAVAAALTQERERAERNAREQAARDNGNFQQLYEQSQAELQVVQLNQWRGQALKAAGLDDKWFDSIQGKTLEDMTTFAKGFKKRLDEDIKTASKQIVTEHPGTPEGGGKSGRHRDKTHLTGQARVGRDLRGAFGANRLVTVQ